MSKIISLNRKNYLKASATFFCDGLRTGINKVKFVVDTGSPITILSYGTAQRLQIPQKILSKEEPVEVAGGKYMRMAFSRDSNIKLRTEDDEILEFDFDGYGVAFPLDQSQDGLRRARSMPNLLGLDFLEKNDLKLVYDGSEDEAYLEKVED